jgi:hypothetical protein
MAKLPTLWAGPGPKTKTPLRQFVRPAPGNRYSDAERKAWSIEQVRLQALRNAPNYQKPTPAPRPSRATELKADTSGSSCFTSLKFKTGITTAVFANPTIGTWQYEMTRSEAKEFFSADSLGGWFNENLR